MVVEAVAGLLEAGEADPEPATGHCEPVGRVAGARGGQRTRPARCRCWTPRPCSRCAPTFRRPRWRAPAHRTPVPRTAYSRGSRRPMRIQGPDSTYAERRRGAAWTSRSGLAVVAVAHDVGRGLLRGARGRPHRSGPARGRQSTGRPRAPGRPSGPCSPRVTTYLSAIARRARLDVERRSSGPPGVILATRGRLHHRPRGRHGRSQRRRRGAADPGPAVHRPVLSQRQSLAVRPRAGPRGLPRSGTCRTPGSPALRDGQRRARDDPAHDADQRPAGDRGPGPGGACPGATAPSCAVQVGELSRALVLAAEGDLSVVAPRRRRRAARTTTRCPSCPARSTTPSRTCACSSRRSAPAATSSRRAPASCWRPPRSTRPARPSSRPPSPRPRRRSRSSRPPPRRSPTRPSRWRATRRRRCATPRTAGSP